MRIKNHEGQILVTRVLAIGAVYECELEADRGKFKGDEKLSIS